MVSQNPDDPRSGKTPNLRQTILRVARGVETIALAAPGAVSSTSGTGPTGGVDLGRVADDSIARLLGGAAADKPEQLRARLRAVFPEQVKDGKTTYSYRATGAQPIDGPSGALVSGAQGAFYAQARAIQGSIDALLDQLVPVVTDPDQPEIDSLVATYRELTRNVVDEFGREGGAVLNRIQLASNRLDATRKELLDKLGLGKAVDANDRREMPLLQRNLIDENMAILKRLTRELTKTLVADYDKKVVNGVSANNTLLAWIFRAIPATLQQVRAQFDAVGIGLADRMVRDVKSGNIKVEQVLQWCEAAAVSDFPLRLAAGRRSDFEAIRAEAKKLHKIVKKLAIQFESEAGGGRLRAALIELREHFKAIRKKAGKILFNPPAPDAGQKGGEPSDGGLGRGEPPDTGLYDYGMDFLETFRPDTRRKSIVEEFLARGRRPRIVILEEDAEPEVRPEELFEQKLKQEAKPASPPDQVNEQAPKPQAQPARSRDEITRQALKPDVNQPVPEVKDHGQAQKTQGDPEVPPAGKHGQAVTTTPGEGSRRKRALKAETPSVDETASGDKLAGDQNQPNHSDRENPKGSDTETPGE